MKHDEEIIKVCNEYDNACECCIYSEKNSNRCLRGEGCGTNKMNEYYVLKKENNDT